MKRSVFFCAGFLAVSLSILGIDAAIPPATPRTTPGWEYAQLTMVYMAKLESDVFVGGGQRTDAKTVNELVTKLGGKPPATGTATELDLFNLVGAQGWEYISSDLSKDSVSISTVIRFKRPR